MGSQSELSTSDVKDTTNGYLVGAGDSPVTCEHPSQNRIATGGAGITRGWKARRIDNEDGYRALYLTIPNNKKSRISVYDFDAIDQDDDISSSAPR